MAGSIRDTLGHRTLVCSLAILVMFTSSPAAAATIDAASCSSSDVKSAVGAALTGDTVALPAGNCDWSETVTIPSDKKLTLQGAGMNQTNITHTSPGSIALDLGQSGSRVTAIGFTDGYIQLDGDDWRIDHVRLTNTSPDIGEGVYIRGDREDTHPRGLVDHNRFESTRVLLIGWAGLAAHVLWRQPLDLGGPQAVFVEDNEFFAEHTPPQVIDTNYGGRYVFRHNMVTNGYLEAHSLQQGRGTRSFEVYGNTMVATKELWTPIFFRGGTGVIYDNTITTSGAGLWNQPDITLDNVRSFSTGYDYGMCDGSSQADGNQQSNGWPCRDQIGQSTDTSLWTTANPYPTQALEPAHFWNNSAPGGPMGVTIHNGTGTWIVEGRDYVNGTPLAGYTPYTYPHPLGGGSGGSGATGAGGGASGGTGSGAATSGTGGAAATSGNGATTGSGNGANPDASDPGGCGCVVGRQAQTPLWLCALGLALMRLGIRRSRRERFNHCSRDGRRRQR